MRRLLEAALVCAVLLGLALPGATAQDPPGHTGYEGVSPGSGNPPPAAGRLARGARAGRRARAAILTWPGFQPMESGASRFFVQTTGPVTTELRSSGDRVEVIFRNTGIHLSNSRRWLETRHFNTPVLRARLERRGRDMALVMQMRSAADASRAGAPRLSDAPGDTGFHFTYVDFAGGDWLPDEPDPMLAPQTPAGSLGMVRADPAPEGPPATSYGAVPDRSMDDEAPPQRGPNP